MALAAAAAALRLEILRQRQKSTVKVDQIEGTATAQRSGFSRRFSDSEVLGESLKPPRNADTLDEGSKGLQALNWRSFVAMLVQEGLVSRTEAELLGYVVADSEQDQSTRDGSGTGLGTFTAMGASGLPNPERSAGPDGAELPQELQQELARRVRESHAPPRAAQLDGCMSDAQVQLGGLLEHMDMWGVPRLSQAYTSKLLTLLEELLARFKAVETKLERWRSGFESETGSEAVQALFWDLLDAAAASPYSAHEFQRTHAPAIEARCARQRVRVASIEPRDAAPRKWAQPTGHFGHGIDSVLGRCADRGFSLQVIRVPHRGVPWRVACELLQSMDATAQLALSEHFPASLGCEPCALEERGAAPAFGSQASTCAHWYVELVDGMSVRALVDAHGPLSEGSLLFTHWRHQLFEALLHISAQSTFLLRRGVELANVRAASRGSRLVLCELSWGVEFAEDQVAPEVAGGARATRGGGQRGGLGGDGRSGSLSDADASSALSGLHGERDRLLLHDGLNCVLGMLGVDGVVAAELAPLQRSRLSPQIRAIIDAGSYSKTVPTLLQLLSHPYFSPVGASRRHQVQLEFDAWTTVV